MILIKILKSTNDKNFFSKSLTSLNLIKKKVKFKHIHNLKKSSRFQTLKQNPLNYILTLSISQTNTLINLSNTEGKLLISLSSGCLNLKKRQKKLQPLALINLLKSLILIADFKKRKSVTIHFKNVKSYYESLVINLLKDVIFIKAIKSSNLQPHNGCRPKKLKKIKRRTKKS